MPSVAYDCYLPQQFNRETYAKHDILDHPTDVKYEANPDDSKKKLFATMKYEINRLNSYKDKWPLNFIKPEELAEAGFFYLQTEDKVQCPFCHVIIYNWTVNDRPLKEHLKNSRTCPLLSSRDVGNYPLFQQKSFSSQLKSNGNYSTESYKPKHPRLADVKRRLMTYKEWPLVNISPTYLSKCGLFYTGVADVVTCFFCGGSLGNWEPGDDPLVEHEKFFPNCAFLALAKSALSGEPSTSVYPSMGACSNTDPLPKSSDLLTSTRQSENKKVAYSEIIEQACEIFPQSLVLEVAAKHFQETGENFSTLADLCEEILEYNTRNSSSKSQDIASRWKFQDSDKVIEETTTPKVEVSNEAKVETCASAARSRVDTLLCKICMDQEMGVVFQPCGHLVSCVKCSKEISNCPLCRKPISNIVRTYLS